MTFAQDMYDQGGDADFYAEGSTVFTPVDEGGFEQPSAEDYGGDYYQDYGAGAGGSYPQGIYEQQFLQQPFPSSAPYGYPSPYGAPSPYGYDPYAAAYGYPQQGYPSPYGGGYAPYGGAYGQGVPGYQYDPYGGMYGQQGAYGYGPYGGGYMDPYAQQAAYQQCALQFPPGTPQSVIDASCAMQQGAVQPWQVQQGVTDLLGQGKTDAANALVQKFMGQPGFRQGEPTADELAKGCKRVVYGGQTIGTICPQVTAPAKGSAGAIYKQLGPVPTDPAACEVYLKKITSMAQFKAAVQAAGSHGALTPEQKAVYSRYLQALKCSGKGAGSECAPGSHSGSTLTPAQTKCGCKIQVSMDRKYIVCPRPGEKITTLSDKLKSKLEKSVTSRQLGRMAYTAVASAFYRACVQQGGGKCKPGLLNRATTTYRSLAIKARSLPDTAAKQGAYTAVMAAVKQVVAAIPSGNYTTQLNTLAAVMRTYSLT